MPEPLPASLQRRSFVVALCVLAPALASAQRPLSQRNLLVEVREVDADAADEAAGWSARTADAAGGRDRVSRRLLVLNGGSAQLHLAQARPIQTWQWGWGSDGAGISATTQWLEAGRRLGVSVRWPGGNEPATVELRAVSDAGQPFTRLTRLPFSSSDTPERTSHQLAV